MKKTVKKIKFLKLKYDRKAPRKLKIILGAGVFILIFSIFLTFLQSSFFFCKVLLPGICKVYDLEISAEKIDVSLLHSEFLMQNITIHDNQNKNELFVNQINGSFRKWGILKKEYYFRYLNIDQATLKVTKNTSSVQNHNNHSLTANTKKTIVVSNDLLEEIPQQVLQIIQMDYLRERFSNLVIDDLNVDGLNIHVSYGSANNPGEIVVSKFKLNLKRNLNNQINSEATGNLKIREPYSQIEKNGSLLWRVFLSQNTDKSQFSLKSKMQIDFPESDEKLICNLNNNTADKKTGNYGSILFKTFKDEKVTSSIKLDSFWQDKYNFHLKLQEAFVAPEILKFASELVYGKTFGIFDGNLSGVLLSNQDEFIFNFYAKLNRQGDKHLDKLEFISDITSRYNRSKSQLMVSSCYAGLSLGEHKLLTLTTPEKYIYGIDKKSEPANFKFDINIDNFDAKIIDYFTLYDSTVRIVNGFISANISSEVVLSDKKCISRINGSVDKLQSTLYNEDYFEFNGYFDLSTIFDYDNLYLTTQTNKVTFVNNLNENLFIADAAGEGWVDFKKMLCDFKVDIFNGNSRVFDTFDWTKQRIKDFPYAKNYLYSLSCRVSVLNDQTFDLTDSCFTVKNSENNIILLQAVASPIELEIVTECETNLNPINIQIVINDPQNDILGNYCSRLKNLPSTANCLMSFGKEFRNWEMKYLNWDIFSDNNKNTAIFTANADFFMDFDRNNDTKINIKATKITENFIEKLLKYDFCNHFAGSGDLAIRFFNDFENSEVKSKINLSEIKFLSHPDNIFSAEWQGLWTFNNSNIDRFENYFSGNIDGAQTILTELHKTNSNKEKIKVEWIINYLDLLNLHNIFAAWKKDELPVVNNNKKTEKTIENKIIENKKNLFNFKDNIEIACNFDNITYGSQNTIKIKGFFDCIDNKIQSKKISTQINNNNTFDCAIELQSSGEKLILDTKLLAEKITLPLIKNNDSDDKKNAKIVRGEIDNFSCELQTILNDNNKSILDNLNGRAGGRIISLIIPNGMTDSLLGNILVYSFEFAAKLIDLLPTRLSFLQGYINLVTKFNENRYYELLFNDGSFEFSCQNGIVEVKEMSMKGEAIDSFECSGKIGIGSQPFMDILSKAKINKIVFPLYFEGVLDDPEVNMTKSAAAFMKNIFGIF